jgi:hypothetical protein
MGLEYYQRSEALMPQLVTFYCDAGLAATQRGQCPGNC